MEFRELYCCNRCALDKICEIYTFDRFVATQKERIGEQLNYF